MPKTTYQFDFHTFVAELLNEQGVSSTPDVTYQLAHFSHSFVTHLRSDAHDLTVGNEGVTPEHIQLAYDLRSFSRSRIQQQDIYKFAERVNQRQFPRIEPHQGLSLPHEQHCLLANNYQYRKFEDVVVPEGKDGRKRKGEDLDESVEKSAAKQKTRNKSEKHIQFDIDALEAELMAELEASTEPLEAVEDPEANGMREDVAISEKQETEDPPKSSKPAETEERTATNGTKLRAAHAQRLTPETRAVVSMDGKN